MKTAVITAGESFTDIDVLACAIAYGELYAMEGKKYEVVLPGTLNSSITPTIRAWDLKFVTKPTDSEYDVVIVDVSELAYVAKFVKPEDVVEVYDHRHGFQDFWDEKLGDNSRIEFVGSCATLIWEQFKKRGFAEKISHLSANLLSIAILSNTLNFGAQVTTDRDKTAFEELKQYCDMPDSWKETYFKESEAMVYINVQKAIISDTKNMIIPNLGYDIVMGQLELWNASEFLGKYKSDVKIALASFNNPIWFMSIPSISENKNYIYTENQELKNLISKNVDVQFDGDVGVTSQMWLRKEIRKKLLNL